LPFPEVCGASGRNIWERDWFQTWHPCLECIFDVNNEKKYSGYRGKLEISEFFGTQTIEGSRKF
jgi:hypothetical protein